MADIKDELAERLIWDDNIRRVQRPVRTGDVFEIFCGCKRGLFSDRVLVPVMDALPVITCRCYRHTEGWVWIGKCKECDLLIFATERGRK